MHYMFKPLHRHFDLGFGAVGDTFKGSADSLFESNKTAPSLNAHLPISFLYRHAIELYLKSAIIIFHRKLQLPYGKLPFDGEPQVLIESKWKSMYSVHGIKILYESVRNLFSANALYLDQNTNTDWSFPTEFDEWIAEIEMTDPQSAFFRYPVTRDLDKDKEKSAIKNDDLNSMVGKINQYQKPLKAFLVVDGDDQIVEAFSHDDTIPQELIIIFQKVSRHLHDCHAALVGELTGGC